MFPEGFPWGVATAAHQIEGGNVNNDWWAWEHNPDRAPLAPSGDACDSFHRWREDIDLVAAMGLARLPLLARVEPDRAGRGRVLAGRPRALPAHVRRLPRQGDLPVVTFHHFTTPLWLAARGGWESPDAPDASPAS